MDGLIGMYISPNACLYMDVYACCLYRVRIDIMVSMNKEIWRELLGGAITVKTAAG